MSAEEQAARDPQFDPDALLELCNDANGHSITWNAEHPPDIAADESEWDEWRQAVIGDIRRHVACSAERQTEVYNETVEALSPTRVIHACASCGVRHFGRFSEWCVSDLPREVFGFDEAAHARREALEEVELVELADMPHASVQMLNETLGEGETVKVATRRVDLRHVVSSFMYGETRFHLHAPLVKEPSDDSAASVMLCVSCNSAALSPTKVTADGEQVLNKPKMSLSDGVDFGNVDALGLPEPTEIERLLLSDVRMYGEVKKVAAPDEKARLPEEWQHVFLKGHSIKFVHSGVERVVEVLSHAVEARVVDLLQKVRPAERHMPCVREHMVGSHTFERARPQMKVHILGPEKSHDVLLRRLLASDEMAIRPTVVYNWLVVRNAIRAAALREDPGAHAASLSDLALPPIGEVVEMLRAHTSSRTRSSSRSSCRSRRRAIPPVHHSSSITRCALC